MYAPRKCVSVTVLRYIFTRRNSSGEEEGRQKEKYFILLHRVMCNAKNIIKFIEILLFPKGRSEDALLASRSRDPFYFGAFRRSYDVSPRCFLRLNRFMFGDTCARNGLARPGADYFIETDTVCMHNSRKSQTISRNIHVRPRAKSEYLELIKREGNNRAPLHVSTRYVSYGVCPLKGVFSFSAVKNKRIFHEFFAEAERFMGLIVFGDYLRG